MKKVILTSVAAAAMLAAFEAPKATMAHEGDHFTVGLAWGRHDSRFDANTTRTIGANPSTKSTHVDKYTGNEFQLSMGHHFETDWGFLHAGVFAGLVGGSYKHTGSDSTLRYENKLDLGLVLQPGVHLTDWLSAHLHLGVNRGSFEFVKNSPTNNTTTYEVKGAKLGYSLGLGLSWHMHENLTMDVHLIQTKYGSQEINATYTPTVGDKTVDSIKVTPSRTMVMAGLRYRF